MRVLTRRVIVDELTERDGQTLFGICCPLTVKHGLAFGPVVTAAFGDTCGNLVQLAAMK